MDCRLDCLESVNNNRFKSVWDLGGFRKTWFMSDELCGAILCVFGVFFSHNIKTADRWCE